MNKPVILLTDAQVAPTMELIESLSSAGISVLIEGLHNADIQEATKTGSDTEDSRPADLIAVLYEVSSEARPEDLRSVVERASKSWPAVSIVACRRPSNKTGTLKAAELGDTVLKRIGFRAVAERPAQLGALLRQVEDGPGTGELKLPPEFKSTPHSRAFSLPPSLRSGPLRGAFSLLSSLHLASNQKEAGQTALAGIARLVPADRWTIFLAAQAGIDSVNLEPLVGRNVSVDRLLFFDEDWRRELLDQPATPIESESKAAREAATRIETIRKTERGRRVVALPLVSGERALGVLEGVRAHAGARRFSATETALLAALAIPIASALANSVRIADAERLSLTDDLTKLHNARYLRQFLVNEIKRARRYGSKVAALFLDLDDFKRVNDMHGHLAGSHALMEIAAVILPSVRDTDCLVRYGGDEFVVILPETGIEQAVQVADRIREKIEHHRFTGGRGLGVSFTASFGVAVFPQHALSPHQLIARADAAMYTAKAAHKNCVRISAESSAVTPDHAGDSHPARVPPFQRIPDEKLNY